MQIISDGLSKKGKKLEVSENLLQEISDKVNAENQKRLQMEEDKGQLTEVIEQLDSRKARVKEEIKGPYVYARRIRYQMKNGSNCVIKNCRYPAST